MAQLFTIPSLAILSVVGIGTGVHLGTAAIDSIKPEFFSSPVSTSYASLSPYRTPDGSASVLAASASDDDYGYGSGCVGCRTYPEEYYPDSSLEDHFDVPNYAASIGAQDGYRQAIALAVEPNIDPGLEAVVHYSSYPITDAERERQQVRREAIDPAAAAPLNTGEGTEVATETSEASAIIAPDSLD